MIENIDTDFIMLFIWYIPLALGIMIGYLICILTLCLGAIVTRFIKIKRWEKMNKKETENLIRDLGKIKKSIEKLIKILSQKVSRSYR